MSLEIQSLNPSIDKVRLQSFESRHGINLPRSYREFLLRNNGGTPRPSAFPISGFENNPFGAVETLFGLNALEETEDLDYAKTELGMALPKDFVPIACTEGSDFICLDLRMPGAPIVFWDRRPSWGNNVWNENDLYPIADDFDSFLALLHHREF